MGIIAIVDDNETGAEAVAFILRASGIKDVRSYNSGKELLDEMRSGFHPEFVITDFFMPEMNGMELLDTIDELHGTIPGVIMTGYPGGIQSDSRRFNEYPILCKGQSDFFNALVEKIGKARSTTGSAFPRSLVRQPADGTMNL